MDKQRIVITGASGFIGTCLVDMLVRNKYNIAAVDLRQPQVKHKGVEYKTGNFANLSFLDEVLKAGDIIIHLACTTVPESSEKYPQKDRHENEHTTIALLDIAVRKNAKMIIFFSSGGTVYGNQGKETIKESANLKPINNHGKMKLGVEKIIEMYQKKYGLNYLIVRPSNPYGWAYERQVNQGIIDVFLRNIFNNKEINVWGKGDIVRDYIYIDDLTNCIVRMLAKGISNEIFNIGTGVGTSVNELIQIIKEITNKKISVNYIESREYDVPCNVLDISKASTLLGWEPRINVNEGIMSVYNKLILN